MRSPIDSDRPALWPSLPGAAVVLVMAAMQFVDFRHGVAGKPWIVSLQVVLCVAAALVAAPAAWRRRREMSRAAWWLAGAFSLISAWSLVSALVAPRAVIRQGEIPRIYQVMPAATGWLTMIAALVVAAAMGRRGRAAALPWAGVAVLAGTLADWPVQAGIHHSPRVASGMGGSAVLHVALLLAATVLADRALAAHREGRPRGVVAGWWAGAGAGLVLTCLTGSRSGLVVLAVTTVLVLITWGRGTARRVLLAAVAAGPLVLVAAVSLVPALHRFTVWQSPLRVATYRAAFEAITENPVRLLTGVGSGTLFPWYAVEAKHIPAPGDGRVIGPDGAVLSSAHSLYVAVLAELGVVMLVVLLAIVAILAARAVGVARRHGRTAAPVTTLALAATTVAWFFDTYLTKNFSLSLWWWVVAFSALSAAPALSAEQPSPSASTDPSHSPAE